MKENISFKKRKIIVYSKDPINWSKLRVKTFTVWRYCDHVILKTEVMAAEKPGINDIFKYIKIFLATNNYSELAIYKKWYIHTHTLTGHFIRYTLLVPDLTRFCLQNCLNSSWHIFNNMLKTFLRDFGPYWHDRITQLLQICRLHIHESLVPPHPKGALLDWDLVTVEAIWVKWTHCHVQETSLRCICDMVHYPAGSSIRRWVHCSHKGMDKV